MIGVQVSADKREMENSEGSSTSPESSVLAPAPESSGTPGNDPQGFLLRDLLQQPVKLLLVSGGV